MFGTWHVDADGFLSGRGLSSPTKLSPTEADFLRVLLGATGYRLTREALRNKVFYGEPTDGAMRKAQYDGLRDLWHDIRKKIEPDWIEALPREQRRPRFLQYRHQTYELTVSERLPDTRGRGPAALLIRERPAPGRMAAEIERYRVHVARLCKRLAIAGIPISFKFQPPELARVYVPPRLVPIGGHVDGPRHRIAGPVVAENAMTAVSRVVESPGRFDLYDVARRPFASPTAAPTDGRLDDAEIPNLPRSVLIEAPLGAGKSVYLRYRARSAADERTVVPVLVQLKGLMAGSPAAASLEGVLDFASSHRAWPQRIDLLAALNEAAGQDAVLFLIDGLDEIGLPQRAAVEQMLEEFHAEGYRSIVTSRPTETMPPDGYSRYLLLPLDDTENGDAELLCRRWLEAAAEQRAFSSDEANAWVEVRFAAIWRRLRSNVGLRELSTNPLMLTFLAILASEVEAEELEELPGRRAPLLEGFVGRIVLGWESRRREAIPGVGRMTDVATRQMLEWAFAELAHFLRTPIEGVPPSREQIIEHVAKEDRLLRAVQADLAVSRASELLGFWEHTGLIQSYWAAGAQRISFTHSILEEYGAARAISRRHGKAGPDLWEAFQPYLARDVKPSRALITLAMAYATTEACVYVIDRLLEGSRSDPSLAVLAGEALVDGADVPAWCRGAVVNELLLQLAKSPGTRGLLEAVSAFAADRDVWSSLLHLALGGAESPRGRLTAAMALSLAGRQDEARAAFTEIAVSPESGADERLVALALRLVPQATMRANALYHQRARQLISHGELCDSLVLALRERSDPTDTPDRWRSLGEFVVAIRDPTYEFACARILFDSGRHAEAIDRLFHRLADPAGRFEDELFQGYQAFRYLSARGVDPRNTGAVERAARESWRTTRERVAAIAILSLSRRVPSYGEFLRAVVKDKRESLEVRYLASLALRRAEGASGSDLAEQDLDLMLRIACDRSEQRQARSVAASWMALFGRLSDVAGPWHELAHDPEAGALLRLKAALVAGVGVVDCSDCKPLGTLASSALVSSALWQIEEFAFDSDLEALCLAANRVSLPANATAIVDGIRRLLREDAPQS